MFDWNYSLSSSIVFPRAICTVSIACLCLLFSTFVIHHNTTHMWRGRRRRRNIELIIFSVFLSLRLTSLQIHRINRRAFSLISCSVHRNEQKNNKQLTKIIYWNMTPNFERSTTEKVGCLSRKKICKKWLLFFSSLLSAAAYERRACIRIRIYMLNLQKWHISNHCALCVFFYFFRSCFFESRVAFTRFVVHTSTNTERYWCHWMAWMMCSSTAPSIFLCIVYAHNSHWQYRFGCVITARVPTYVCACV